MTNAVFWVGAVANGMHRRNFHKGRGRTGLLSLFSSMSRGTTSTMRRVAPTTGVPISVIEERFSMRRYVWVSLSMVAGLISTTRMMTKASCVTMPIGYGHNAAKIVDLALWGQVSTEKVFRSFCRINNAHYCTENCVLSMVSASSPKKTVSSYCAFESRPAGRDCVMDCPG